MTESLCRPIRIGSLTLPGNVFLAPVAGWTDRAFRTICQEYGADFGFTELSSAEAIVRGPEDPRRSKTGALMRRGEGERRYAIQLFGGDPETMYRAAIRLAPFAPDGIDLNAGCPVPKVTKTGAGSALMRDIPRLGRIVAALVRASEEALGGIPVTVKIRSGWDSGSINYLEAAKAAEEAGAAMVTLHPRTRAQGYGGKSDWSLIGDLVTRLGIPVAGSGDLFSAEDARRMLAETRCAAVMFARGAQGNPFVFAETKALLATPAAPALAAASVPPATPAASTAPASSATPTVVPGTIAVGTATEKHRATARGGTASGNAVEWTPPSPAERIAAAFRHLALLAGDMGEAAACREMRKQFCAYTKGLPGSARLRDALVHAGTVGEFQDALGEFMQPEAGCNSMDREQ